VEGEASSEYPRGPEGNAQDDRIEVPLGEDWGCSWITEGRNGGENKREGPRASLTALRESRSGPRAQSACPLLLLLHPPPRPLREGCSLRYVHFRSPGQRNIRRKLRCQPELPEGCGQW